MGGLLGVYLFLWFVDCCYLFDVIVWFLVCFEVVDGLIDLLWLCI